MSGNDAPDQVHDLRLGRVVDDHLRHPVAHRGEEIRTTSSAAGYGWNETRRFNNVIAGPAKEVLARLRTACERVLETTDALNDITCSRSGSSSGPASVPWLAGCPSTPHASMRPRGPSSAAPCVAWRPPPRPSPRPYQSSSLSTYPILAEGRIIEIPSALNSRMGGWIGSNFRSAKLRTSGSGRPASSAVVANSSPLG